MKALVLSFLMISAIVVTGVGIYTADAAGSHVVTDGYGISAVAQ